MEVEGPDLFHLPHEHDDLVENPNGSTSATASSHLCDMVPIQVEAILNHPGRQAQLKGKKRSREDLVQNPSSAPPTDGTSRLLGAEVRATGGRDYPYPDPSRCLHDPEIYYVMEGGRYVRKMKFLLPVDPELVKRKTPTSEDDPYFKQLVAAGYNAKVVNGRFYCKGRRNRDS